MRVVLLTPSRGSVSVERETMVLRLSHQMRDAGHKLIIDNETTPGLLHHSRAVLLQRLASQPAGTRGFWLDADTLLPPARVLWGLSRPEGVIVWGYPVRVSFDIHHPPEGRQEDAFRCRSLNRRRWTVAPKMNGTQLIRSADGQLVELLYSGFGAVLMTSEVAKDLHDSQGPHQIDWNRTPLSSAFDHEPFPAARSSEDVSFWNKLRARGHRVWCDPDVYVTNGQSGGRYADEIRWRESQEPWLCALSGIACQ